MSAIARIAHFGLFLALWPGFALADPAPHFPGVLERQPEKIWSTELPKTTRDSLQAYQQHAKLPNGTVYGSQIRSLDLDKSCSDQVLSWAQSHQCTRKDDVIREPKNNLPVHDPSGKTIPLISFLCPDGGVIRIKPVGDPMSRYDAKPEAVKAMRFFGSDRYENFSDEAFKIDNGGLAIPKWPKDLNLNLPGLSRISRARYIDEWAHDAHSAFKACD